MSKVSYGQENLKVTRFCSTGSPWRRCAQRSWEALWYFSLGCALLHCHQLTHPERSADQYASRITGQSWMEMTLSSGPMHILPMEASNKHEQPTNCGPQRWQHSVSQCRRTTTQARFIDVLAPRALLSVVSIYQLSSHSFQKSKNCFAK